MGGPVKRNGRPQGKSIRERSFKAMSWFIGALQGATVFGGLAVVLLMQVPLLDGPFKKAGFGEDKAIALTIIAAAVAAIYVDVRAINAELGNMTRHRHHLTDPMDVYPILLEGIQATTKQNERVLEVMGLTLYTAWPSIHFWLYRPELAGWTIRFTAVIDSSATDPVVPTNWFEESRRNLNQITELSRSRAVEDRRISLEAYGYDFMPAVHGYRLGNGDLFYSLLLWQEDGRIGRLGYSYEHITHTDTSPSAQAIRAVFDSWLHRARLHPWLGHESDTARNGMNDTGD